MKNERWLVVTLSLVLVWLLSCIGSTGSYYSEGETSTADSFEAWVSNLWLQTSQIDFNAGLLENISTSLSLDDVQLGTATITLGDSVNDGVSETYADTVYTQIDNYTSVPQDGRIISWTYYNSGATSTGAMLEFLSGSGSTWTMMAKSEAVTITGTNTFTASIPVQAGWQLGLYPGSGNLKYNSTGGTVLNRAENSGDFALGDIKTDFSQFSGHLSLTAILNLDHYNYQGRLASPVQDSHVSGANWNALSWNKTLQNGTNITFEVRASDTLFTKEAATPSWVPAGDTSPVISGLPSGRYKQWRATLTTTDTSKTPTLHEVRVYNQ